MAAKPPPRCQGPPAIPASALDTASLEKGGANCPGFPIYFRKDDP